MTRRVKKMRPSGWATRKPLPLTSFCLAPLAFDDMPDGEGDSWENGHINACGCPVPCSISECHRAMHNDRLQELDEKGLLYEDEP